MEPIRERCCGLDVHQGTVVACLLIGGPNQKARKEIRTFGTMTRDLMELRQWLSEQGCTHVGMESTGVYWKPVYNVLEGGFDLTVGNARHIKNVPGRKTDVKDSEWIAELLRHGLIAKSFVPPPPIRELRELLRYRRKLVQSRSAERNRMIQLLESANIKLSSVASDVFGVSGMLMLKALLEGNKTAEQMAHLAKGQLNKKVAELSRALEGRFQQHHRYLLGQQMKRLGEIDTDIKQLDQHIEQKLEPYRKEQELLMQIPGVDWAVASVIVAELGVDMTVFLSEGHLASWAGVCPGNQQSAGHNKSGKSRPGNVHLKTALVGAAVSAAKKKGSYLKDKYYRLKARRGAKRAQMAIAHKILVAAYHMLSTGQSYKDLGHNYLDRLSESQVAGNLMRRLERMGYEVTVQRKTKTL